MGWKVRGLNTGGGEVFAHVQNGPGAHTPSCTIGAGSFPRAKRPELCVDHPSPSSAEVEERVEVYLYAPSGPSWLVTG